MDTTIGVILIGVGVVIGIYIASQISEHIDSKQRHKQFMKNLNEWQEKCDKKK